MNKEQIPTASARALELRDISHAYGSLQAVDGVSLTIEPGELVCLLGPSGCGKSTTLRLVAGIEKPASGEILIDEKSVASGHTLVPPEHRNTGLVFQDFALFPHLTVLGNVMFGLRGKDPHANERRALASLAQVGMEDFVAKFPNTLSGGEQQRVALARALAPRPALMLMDEPFSGLDRRLRDHIRDETLALLKQEKTATLMVTHDPEEALRMADKIALMRKGKFVQVGTPAELYNNPVDLQTAAFFSDVNVILGEAQAGFVDTPFGKVAAPGFADGKEATIAFRPHALEISPSINGSANAVVTRTRMLGEKGLIEFEVPDLEGSRFAAHITPQSLPENGTDISLSLQPGACFVFEGHHSL